MDKTMGDMICELRKEKGLTQASLADKLNVTDKAVSKWERNLSYPDINTLTTLASVLGVSADELLNLKRTEIKREENVIEVILKALPLAMGVVLIVLSLLKKIDLYSGFSFAGIAIFCLAIYNFKNK